MKRFDRRTLLRGTLVGGAVTVGLPLLDCFLNENGDALAQGAPLPLRFGAWMWGCGMNPDRWSITMKSLPAPLILVNGMGKSSCITTPLSVRYLAVASGDGCDSLAGSAPSKAVTE